MFTCIHVYTCTCTCTINIHKTPHLSFFCVQFLADSCQTVTETFKILTQVIDALTFLLLKELKKTWSKNMTISSIHSSFLKVRALGVFIHNVHVYNVPVYIHVHTCMYMYIYTYMTYKTIKTPETQHSRIIRYMYMLMTMYVLTSLIQLWMIASWTIPNLKSSPVWAHK